MAGGVTWTKVPAPTQCLQLENRAGISGRVLHRGWEGFSMTTAFGLGFFGPVGVVWLLFCCFLRVLLFFFSPPPSLHSQIFCTFKYNNTHFHETSFTSQHFITEGVQHVPYSFFLSYKSFRNSRTLLRV